MIKNQIFDHNIGNFRNKCTEKPLNINKNYININSNNKETEQKNNNFYPKANLESDQAIPKRQTKALNLKNNDYSSQIASLPFGNVNQRQATNDLSMANNNIKTNPSSLIKQMKDFRSEIENLPGSTTNRISNEKMFSGKGGALFPSRLTLTSPEINSNCGNEFKKKKYISENEKTCIKEIDIRESKVRQFQQKKDLLSFSYQEEPIIKPEFRKSKPNNYINAFKSNIQLY